MELGITEGEVPGGSEMGSLTEPKAKAKPTRDWGRMSENVKHKSNTRYQKQVKVRIIPLKSSSC
jgi:hypothetical protein